jgi:hypothetical protein
MLFSVTVDRLQSKDSGQKLRYQRRSVQIRVDYRFYRLLKKLNNGTSLATTRQLPQVGEPAHGTALGLDNSQ